MHRLISTLILSLQILAISTLSFAWDGKVVSVTDGDTIKVLKQDSTQVKIRLYGIDTPEKGQPFGNSAKRFTADLVAGKQVEIEEVTTDRYGRTVGIVNVGELVVNKEIVRSGYAWVYRRYCDQEFCSDWTELERIARDTKFGLWKDRNPMPPWEWRKRK